jgi:hypothetical protein
MRDWTSQHRQMFAYIFVVIMAMVAVAVYDATSVTAWRSASPRSNASSVPEGRQVLLAQRARQRLDGNSRAIGRTRSEWSEWFARCRWCSRRPGIGWCSRLTRARWTIWLERLTRPSGTTWSSRPSGTARQGRRDQDDHGGQAGSGRCLADRTRCLRGRPFAVLGLL